MLRLFAEDQYVTLSALQHFTFCPRQCALIYTEQVWSDNVLTTLGSLEHERVHTAPPSWRGGVYTERHVALVSHRLGIYGVSDVVEYQEREDVFSVIPVEYKHGKVEISEADQVQLCAQAICLEEMRGCRVPVGFLFYHNSYHRLQVQLDEELREKTAKVIEQTRKLLLSRILPPARRMPHCRACSLFDVCLPPKTARSAARYIERQVETNLADHVNG